MTITINESGMIFGPFPKGYCFHIEKSATYEKLKSGVKMAEFLLLFTKNGNSPIIWVVEAKSSTPKPETQPGFNDFIGEIREKWTNALSLGLASCLKRHPHADAELPASFKDLDLAAVGFRFILVINGHKDEWLPPLQDALAKALHSTMKTWALPATTIAVMNDNQARKHKLI